MVAKRKVRLSKREINVIKELAKDIFGENTQVYLFGSRTDLTRRGGDIDLYIKPENREDIFNKKLKFLVKLKSKLGEQKIDVIISGYSDKTIERIAKETGVML